MLDFWGKIILLIPYIGFYFYFLPLHLRDTAKTEERIVKYSRAPLKTMKDTVTAFQKDILKTLVWTNFAFVASMIINVIRGVYDVSLIVFLLSTSLVILLVSTLVRDIRGHETAIGVSVLLATCLFAGNAGYILFYGVSWLPPPLLGFFIFFLVMLFVPRTLLLFPITKLRFLDGSRYLRVRISSGLNSGKFEKFLYLVLWIAITALTVLATLVVLGGFYGIRFQLKVFLDLDLPQLVQSGGIIGALLLSIYALFKAHRFAKERIKLEKIFEQKVASYRELYGIVVRLMKILLPERIWGVKGDALAEALLETDKRMYIALVKELYPFVLKGKDIYLSKDLEKKVARIVIPIYKRESLYGFDAQKELEDESQLRQAIDDYKKQIKIDEVVKILEEIEKSIRQDLELERTSREFA